MKLSFTKRECKYIEKVMDGIARDLMTVQNQMIMDGQFRAGSNKLLSEKENKIVKDVFWKVFKEQIDAYNLIKSIREELEKVTE